MKVVILAAGYATRLRSVTNNGEIAKTMLPISAEGKTQPMLYFLLDKINKINEDEDIVDEVVIITNEKYVDQLTKASENYNKGVKISVMSDGTTSTADALGANGDMRFVNNRMKSDEPVLIVASDNYFEFELKDLINHYEDKQDETNKALSMIVSIEFPPEQLEYGQNGFAMLTEDENGKVTSMVEKPLKFYGKMVDSNKGAIACYVLDKSHYDLINRYMEIYKDDKNLRDSMGCFMSWLANHIPVYNFSYSGKFYDIGTPDQYYEMAPVNWQEEVDNFNL